MSTSSQLRADSPTGFEELKALSDEQFLEALKRKHIDSIHAPRSVKEIVQRMYSLLMDSKKREQAKYKEASDKILSVYDHYSILEEMYKTEHNAVLKLTDEKAELKAEAEILSSKAEQKANEIRKQLNTQREEANKQATKQAMGRKRLEDILVAKNIEIDSTRRRLQEMETQNAKLQAELQTSKSLMGYYLTSAQLGQFNAQVQQYLLQQQQQQQNQQP
ncbi:hypothetical protein PS15m_004401 [Mucor circinelloides]